MPSCPDFSRLALPLIALAAGVSLLRGVAPPAAEGSFRPDPQAVPKQDTPTLVPGSPAPDFHLPDLQGHFRSLADYADAKVLTIVFLCNHCPTAQAYEDRLIEYAKDYKEQGVQLVAIMPNSVRGLLLEECGYSDLNDSYPEMQIRARDKGYNFPYLYDGDDHAASLKFGPVATPHVFVFDADRKLQYVGRIDAHEKPGTGQAEDLRAATDAALRGEAPAVRQTKTFGCSVKWAWKNDWAVQVNQAWAEKPVTLESIDLETVGALVANEGSGKLRLVNFWATWCAPCVIEYPSFVETHRMYYGRDFEFVSVSMDNPDRRDQALAFLEKTDSAVTNYIFTGDDKYAFMEAVDPDWNGALPYTLLIEPGGRVVWRHQGPVDVLAMRRAIVDHEMLGRVY